MLHPTISDDNDLKCSGDNLCCTHPRKSDVTGVGDGDSISIPLDVLIEL